MQRRGREEALSLPAAERPAVLDGHWLGLDGSCSLVAARPASVLEGGADELGELPSWLAWHAQEYPQGAAIGFFSYDLARFFEKLPLGNTDSLPDLSFAYYSRIQKVPRQAGYLPDGPRVPCGVLRTRFDVEGYNEAAERIRGYIAAGDIYQANLTQQFSIDAGGESPEQIYRRLSSGQELFHAFLKTPRRTVLSISPERFFRITGRRIVASPIKGTIARTGDAAADRRQLAKLLSSPKDRAENIMIVDLLRNDLGRISEYGSIRVKLCEALSLPHLFHLVSHVEGTLRREVGVAEVLRALFPCGSVTGAPKIRAMEILAEIERTPRGVSMGAIGIIAGTPGTDAQQMDFNVAIRTLAVEDGSVVFNVGGGIVYDSKAEQEYEEMQLKARPLLEALGALESGELREAAATPLER